MKLKNFPIETPTCDFRLKLLSMTWWIKNYNQSNSSICYKFIYLYLFRSSGGHDLPIWVIRLVSYEKQELFIILEHLCSPLGIWWDLYWSFFLVFCVVFFVFFIFVKCLVCRMLSMALDCSFLIAPSCFSNIYLLWTMCFWNNLPRVLSKSSDWKAK